MRISIEKLMDLGYDACWDEKRRELEIHGRPWNSAQHELYRSLCETLDLDDTDRDRIADYIWRCQVLGDLRRL